MRTASCKAKGRRLQQAVRDALLATFPSLTLDDVRSTSMGASGSDLLLSSEAKRILAPFHDWEMKNTERLNVWGALSQRSLDVLVFSRNRSQTYVALTLEHFLATLKKGSTCSLS